MLEYDKNLSSGKETLTNSMNHTVRFEGLLHCNHKQNLKATDCLEKEPKPSNKTTVLTWWQLVSYLCCFLQLEGLKRSCLFVIHSPSCKQERAWQTLSELVRNQKIPVSDNIAYTTEPSLSCRNCELKCIYLIHHAQHIVPHQPYCHGLECYSWSRT